MLGKLYSYSKKMKLQYFPTLYININTTWVKNLNVKLNIIKLLEEIISRTCSDINQSNISFDPSPRIMEINEMEIKK